MIKEFSIFLENSPGILAQLIKLLDSSEISIQAISVAETEDYGLVLILVDKPEECEEVLNENEYNFTVAEIVAVSLANKVSILYDISELMGVNGINIEYLYSTLVMDEIHLILRTNNNQRAANVLAAKGFSILKKIN